MTTHAPLQLDQLRGQRILVVGDLILDRYTWGNAERVSPEAPVLVLRADEHEVRPGGAASVATLLRRLDAKVTLAGIVGQDGGGRSLLKLLQDDGINAEMVHSVGDRPTTSKERFIGRAANRHAHQILRVDHETRQDISAAVERRLCRLLVDAIPNHDALIVSDYAKGACTPQLLGEVLKTARQHQIPAIVDPARIQDYHRYHGATIITPNRQETELATDRSIRSATDALELGQVLVRQLNLEAVFVTLDRDGIAIVSGEQYGSLQHLQPAQPREVYDITGAGDMVAAITGICQAAGVSLPETATDDTQVKLIDKSLRGTRLARYWAYVGDRGHPYIVYDFTESRQREGPQRFLSGYEGYLQADAYGGYDGIYLESGGAIVEVACWAHCRRYWWKARRQDPPRAHHVLGVIAQLYKVERAARELTPDDRQQLRSQHAAPLLEQLQDWLDQQELLPKSLIGQAATYTRNQWTALNRYLEDGQLSIDNNVSERCVKPVAIGRKNWLFVGSPQAGARAARLMSLIASCKDNRVEPWAYLRDLFTRLPAGAAVDAFLPDRWLVAHPQHRWAIADRRADERAAKGQL